MDMFLPIAAKSFLIAGVVLLLLKLAKRRSASDRSWIAHLGLASILLLPVAAIALPALEVAGPAFLTPPAAEVAVIAPATAPSDPVIEESAASAANFPEAEAASAWPAVNWSAVLYGAPAALLLLLTLTALARLIMLKGRATVLVEPNWLTALARAQQRMGFKHGTALLTSDDLPSPISWGLMRPVILLNSSAARSHSEAEAIIAHELAHVANFDWAKLLLGRLTVAMFWFNPLVWLLAREAHQLREEAADDAVLGTDIEDVDYAGLLVGAARHECRGMFIGAHGVAPSKGSLARRIARVLDPVSVRGSAGRSFAFGVFVGAATLAAPLAALTLSPDRGDPATGAAAQLASSEAQGPYYTGPVDPAAPQAPMEAVTSSVTTALTAAGAVLSPGGEVERDLEEAKRDMQEAARDIAEARREALAEGRDPRVEQLVAAKVHGVTPAYVADMRAASPALARAQIGDFVGMKIQGVSPSYVRELEASGMRLSAKQLTTARIHGLNGSFVRSMAAAGYPRLSFDQAVKMRIFGVTPQFVRELKRSGLKNPTASQLISYRIKGFAPRDDHGHDAGPDVDVDIDVDVDPDVDGAG